MASEQEHLRGEHFRSAALGTGVVAAVLLLFPVFIAASQPSLYGKSRYVKPLTTRADVIRILGKPTRVEKVTVNGLPSSCLVWVDSHTEIRVVLFPATKSSPEMALPPSAADLGGWNPFWRIQRWAERHMPIRR